MADDLSLFYWDACIFYEYLRDEQTDAPKKIAIREILAENKQKRNRICTSVITHTEVLPAKIGDPEAKQYEAYFSSMYFFDVEFDRSVVSLARTIKDYYYKPVDIRAGTNAKMISTGDAIYLATAIIHKVTELHTRDGNRKGGNVPIIGLAESSANGRICGQYGLKIVSPNAAQGDLGV